MTEPRDMTILRNEPLSRWTSLGVGGPAEALCRPVDKAELIQALEWARDQGLPLAVLGGGCNVLVPDEGFAGLVVVMSQGFDQLSWQENNSGRVEITAGAGLKLSSLVRRAVEEGWSGLAFLAGLPGTVGGAAMMNAGAWGISLGDVLQSLSLIGREGRVLDLPRAELNYQYRRLDIQPDLVVIEISLKSEKADPERVETKVNNWLAKRKKSQPLNYPSAGSFFKNPVGDYAGRLIEAVGLKGLQIGGAKVSEVHANFIINRERAKAEDIIALAREIYQRVKERFGVDLEPEVRLLGYGDTQWVRQ